MAIARVLGVATVAVVLTSPPSWAARGFLVYKCGDALCLIRAGGTGERPLLRAGPWPQWDAAVSPDGRSVAFRGYWGPGDGAYALYVARTGGCGVRRLTQWVASDPTWSPDGRWIAFDTSGGGVLWKVRPDGTGLTRLAGGRTDPDWFPAWSPRGSRIAFVHYRRGGFGEVWVVGSDGRHARRLHADAGASDESPAWSHDGTRVAFAVQIEHASWIEIVDADGANPRVVTSRAGHAWNAVWLPHDAGLAYLELTGNTGTVYAVRPNGRDATRLPLPQTPQLTWAAAPLPPRC